MEGIQVSTQVAGSHNQISIIKVGGYIDTTTSSEVERELNALLKQRRFQIIIDLGNVDYISSAGWGIFISEIKQIRENNGDLKLVRMIPDVYEIFELLEFHHILDVYDSIQAAVNKFEESQYVEMVPGGDSEIKEKGRYASEPAPHNRPALDRMDSASEMPEPARHSTRPVTPEEPPQRSAAPKKPTILDLVSMPVEDKIKYIVAKDPELGAYKINKRLNSPDFGFTKVGWFGVRSWLKKLNLNSRENRHKFAARYRSQ
jgi:anti-sigma B factor antagonist